VVSVLEGEPNDPSRRSICQGQWTTYIQGQSYIVNYFLSASDDEKHLIGMEIPPDRFRFWEPPDPRLVAWHYNQAIKARIRGFAVDMGAAAQ